jgi:hypothetical protein
VVTADGRVRHVDASTNEDLYWACRGGGGGNFGVVTLAHAADHRVSRAAYFFVSWPWSQASEAIAPGSGSRPHAPRALDVDPVARPHRRLRRPASVRARPVLRQRGGAAAPIARSPRRRREPDHGHSGYFTMVLRWAGCLDGGLAACHRSTRSSFYAKSDYFDRRGAARRARR